MTGASRSGYLELSDRKKLTLLEFQDAARHGAQIEIETATLARMDVAFEASRQQAALTELYGVSTGLGPMIKVAVPPEALCDLQYNLIRSHAAGMGEPLSIELSKAVMLARLQSLTRNRSAVRGELAAHIVRLFNAGIAPFIPRKGGVGASGDLVQLAHLGLLMIGEGPCWLQGQKLPAREAYAGLGFEPLSLAFRDGLAFVNGTSVMTAMGAQACYDARRLLDCAIDFSCLLIEILDASRQPYTQEVQNAKEHAAQIEVARRISTHLGETSAADIGRQRAELQAPYSIRCAPQLLGPMFDALAFAEKAVVDELNSASDNPVFDPATGTAFHGGNFHGEAVALALDVLKISVVKCSLLMERQLNLLLNDAVNGKLPPFLNLGRLGIDLGLQGAQFTATSAAAENQSLAYPMSLHTIPSNKDNQDVVSMGANAAWMVLQTLGNAFDIASILAIALSQGVEAGGAGERLSKPSRMLVERWRGVMPVFRTDTVLSEGLAGMSSLLREKH
jgi:histidine ammonia-lyase